MLVSFVLQIAVRGLPDRGSSLLQDLFSRFSFLFSPSVVRLLSTLSTICPYVRLTSDVVPSQFFFAAIFCDLFSSCCLFSHCLMRTLLRTHILFSDNLDHFPTIFITEQLLRQSSSYSNYSTTTIHDVSPGPAILTVVGVAAQQFRACSPTLRSCCLLASPLHHEDFPSWLHR